MSARLIRWQSAHLTDLLLIKSVWKIRKNSLKWEVASNWHLTFFGWNSPKKYVFTRIFYKSTEFPTNRKKLDYSPPLILKLKFIAFIIFLQNSNRSNMCAAIAQRRLVTRKFQIEENMRIVALKSTQKMPRRICAARCWKCPARNTCEGSATSRSPDASVNHWWKDTSKSSQTRETWLQAFPGLVPQ